MIAVARAGAPSVTALGALLLPRRQARHARSSRLGPALVAGGMVAAFVAVDGAVLASPASAGGSVAQFERLAGCESGGNWSINTGNGYYGGIQFNLATWRGLGFAGYPHKASKATQVAAGQKLQGQRGWSPWPACSRKLGLRGNGGVSGYSTPAAAKAKPAAASNARREASARASARRAQAVRLEAARVAARQAMARLSAAKQAQKRLLVPQIDAVAAHNRRVAAPLLLEPTAAPSFTGAALSTEGSGYRVATQQWQRRMAARGWKIRTDGVFDAKSSAVAYAFSRDGAFAHRRLTSRPGTVGSRLFTLAWTAPVTA